VPLFYCMNLFSPVNLVCHNLSFTHNYYSFTQSLLVAKICRWKVLAVPLMRPLRQVVMVLGQVVVVETTSTTMSPTMNRIYHLLPRSLQRYSLHSCSGVSTTRNNLRRIWRIFYVPLPTMFNTVTIRVVAMG
jgi:hypothetical protein